MHQGAVAAVLLGLVGVLHGVPLASDPLYPTQENFDLDRFMGKWHDVAVASTCPWMKRHRGDAAIGSLVLEKADTAGKVKMTRTSLRHGTCKQISGDYETTSTPGRFNYHVARWGADVDAYVYRTVYDEYAIVIMSKEKAGRNKTTSLKLYSRTMTVRPTVMADFKKLVKEQGMADDAVTVKKNKGECTPEQAAETGAAEPQRSRRDVVLPMFPAEEEGSGDATSFFSTEACRLGPDRGACFGIVQRYFYNSNSMSCQLFNYGGCAGNQNNFLSERECLQSCRTEAACRLPMAPSPCTGQPPVWAFDSSSGLCLPYKQGVCQGNANKFYSRAECQEYCGVAKEGEGEFLKAN